LHGGVVQGLGAHEVVGVEGTHDGVEQFGFQVGGVGKLFLGVVGGLLAQGFGFQQLAFDDVVDVHQLVLVAQLALEQVVDLLDDLGQAGFFFFVQGTAAGLGNGFQLGGFALVQGHGPPPGVPQVVMGEDHFGEVNALALAAKFQQGQQAFEKDGAFLNGGVAVIEDLGQEGVQADSSDFSRATCKAACAALYCFVSRSTTGSRAFNSSPWVASGFNSTATTRSTSNSS